MNKNQQLTQKFGLTKIPKYAKALNAVCPVAQVNKEFSPALIAKHFDNKPEELLTSRLLWECLCCGLCEEVSGNAVQMSFFVQELRAQAVSKKNQGTQTHQGMLLTVQRMQAPAPQALKQNRTSWIPETLSVHFDKGTYLYWTGLAPYFEAVLDTSVAAGALAASRAAIKLINQCGIIPVILNQEYSSGHDLLWTGDKETFKKLAQQNLKAIKNSGARFVIVSSPEDCYTLKHNYPQFFGPLNFEVVHITEFLVNHLPTLRFKPLNKKITYHDPCRLARFLGVVDAPRQLLSAIPGLELVEMERNRKNAACCGTSCWTQCSRFSKLMQVQRLQEACATGAELMVTACMECAIHFTCAMQASAWQQVSIPVKNITTVLAEQLYE